MAEVLVDRGGRSILAHSRKSPYRRKHLSLSRESCGGSVSEMLSEPWSVSHGGSDEQV